MDPISYAAFVFALGWVASHAFGEKRDEYEHAQDAHREKYMNRLAQKHPHWSKARQARYLQNAARRNAAGHLAYLLRHGWSSTFNDFTHGWKTAKAAHEEWKAERAANGESPSPLQALKAGWRRNKATREAEKAKAAPIEPSPAPTSAPAPDPHWREKHDLENKYQRYAELRRRSGSDLTPAQLVSEVDVDRDKAEELAQSWNDRFQHENPEPAGTDADAKVLPITGRATKAPGNTAGSTNGSTTVEYSLDASKAAISEIGEYNGAKISVIEQIIADAIAGNLSADTESMSHLANLQEALANVRAHANAFVDSVTKHAAGQEYANTGHAANTDYLKSR